MERARLEPNARTPFEIVPSTMTGADTMVARARPRRLGRSREECGMGAEERLHSVGRMVVRIRTGVVRVSRGRVGLRTASQIFGCVALLAILALSFTRFEPVESVLAQDTWGYGDPSSTWVTAFATGRPWWNRYRPEALVREPDGGFRAVVAVPRDRVRQTHELVVPRRGIAYSAMLGAVTWARGLGSPDLVFDWALVLRLQHAFLIAAVAVFPLFLMPALATGRAVGFLVRFVGCSAVVLAAYPNTSAFVTDGIIDSAVAAPLALLSAGALAVAMRSLGRRTARAWAT